jgi:HD-GYP domain-containing protein (c-di-GMP phosphodiesterase class II)
LKGEEISLASRIICVVDVFDALSNRRCYRDAISPKDTLTYMAEEMIDQFYPLVFDVISQVIMSNEFLFNDKEVS